MLKEELMKARIRVAQEVLEGKRDSMLRCEAESKVAAKYDFVVEFDLTDIDVIDEWAELVI